MTRAVENHQEQRNIRNFTIFYPHFEKAGRSPEIFMISGGKTRTVGMRIVEVEEPG